MNLQGKVALVTGASSGIGAATARCLAQAGLTVILVARRAERLQALAAELETTGSHAHVLPVDLTVPAERERLWTEVNARYGGVDVLINNAGLGWYGYAAEMRWEQADSLVQVNVAAVVQLTLLALPTMQARGYGHIVNVSSVAGSLPSQGAALYSASKAFLDNFTIALARELRGSGVWVSVIKPGPVATEFFDVSAQRSGGRHIPVERLSVTAEAVARQIWGVLRRPRRVTYVPWWLGIVPAVEFYFGWVLDLVGPLLLRREYATVARRQKAARNPQLVP